MEKPRVVLSSNRMALGIKSGAIILATMAIYFQDLTIIANDAIGNDLMSYLLAIPFLFVYLIYRRRKMLKAVISFETASPNQKPTYIREIIGVLLCLIAFLLYWHGSYTFYPLEYHMISLPVFAAGLVLIIFNAKTLRVLAFPIAFLFFLTPPPTEIISIAGASVATLSSDISYNILKTIGMPVAQISEYGAPALVVIDPSGSQVSFVVGTASSGIHSIIGFGIFAVFIMYISRGPAWKKATVFLACLPIIYVLTVLRIMVLVSLGYWQGVNVAWDIFHLLGGSVLIFIGSITLLFISEKFWKLRIFATEPSATPCTKCNSSSKTGESSCPTCGKITKYPHVSLSTQDIGKMVMLVIVTALIVTLSVPVLALSVQPPQVLTKTIGNEEATATEILPAIEDYSLKFAYRDTQFERIATRDRALVYAYNRENSSLETVFVAIEIGASRATWHSWEASVIIWPQQHGRPSQGVQLDLREIQLLSNPPLMGKYFAFRQTASNTTQVVLYWMEAALFDTGSRTESKYVKMSLVVFPKDSGRVQETETLLLPFANAIISYWQPLKTWSQVNLTIAQNGALLATIPITLLTIILLQGFIGKFRERKSNLRIFSQLNIPEEKLILQAAYQASKKDQPITSAIAVHYKKLTGKTVETETLIQKLNEAEKLGLVKRDIASREDQPIIVWKSHTPLGKSRLTARLTNTIKLNRIFRKIPPR
jgi:exosortase